MADEVKKDQLWKHYKGGTYRVLDTAFREDDRAVLVLYREERDGPAPTWCRPLADWFRPAEGGRPRYELVGEGEP